MMCANFNLGLRQRDMFLGVAVGAAMPMFKNGIPSVVMGYPTRDPIEKHGISRWRSHREGDGIAHRDPMQIMGFNGIKTCKSFR